MADTTKLAVTEYLADNVGLTSRVLVDDDGRFIRLHLDPWSTRNKRAELGQLWRGRVVSKVAGGGGCLVDIGLSDPTFLQTKKHTPPIGSLVTLKIKSEARFEKSAVSVLDNTKISAKDAIEIGRLKSNQPDTFLNGVEVIETIEGRDAFLLCEEARELALATSFSLQGGGKVHIEPTRALVAIDVDAGARISKGDRSNFAFQTNCIAIKKIASQISLSSLAGLVAIDFLKMGSHDLDAKMQNILEDELAKMLGRRSQIAKMSPFGVMEASIAHTYSPISFVWNELGHMQHASLSFLRDLELEARLNRGHVFKAKVSRHIESWLNETTIDWKIALEDRIGRRFNIIGDDSLADDDYKIGFI